MLKTEQTEFWNETASPRLRTTAAPIPSAAEDYFLDEDFEREPLLNGSAELTASTSTELTASFSESEALEAIVVPEVNDASPRLLDVSESIDSIERRLEENAAEAKLVAESVIEPQRVVLPAPSRPRGTVARRTYAQQDAPQPRFNMTRLLRLTGSLDAVDDREHWYDLPKRHFRAIFTLRARRSGISRDFHKDLTAPPRGVTIRKYGRSEGWLTLK